MKKLVFIMALLIFFGAIFSFTSCNFGKMADDSSVENMENTHNEIEVSDTEEASYILNKNTKKIHRLECYVIHMINEENKIKYEGDKESIMKQGYEPCLKCNP